MALLGSHCITDLPVNPGYSGRKSGVYVIQNIRTARVYVGSSKDLRLRWAAHLSTLRRGDAIKALQRDWDAHGPESFTFNVVQSVTGNRLHLEYALRAAEQSWANQLAPIGLYNQRLHIINPRAYAAVRARS